MFPVLGLSLGHFGPRLHSGGERGWRRTGGLVPSAARGGRLHGQVEGPGLRWQRCFAGCKQDHRGSELVDLRVVGRVLHQVRELLLGGWEIIPEEKDCGGWLLAKVSKRVCENLKVPLDVRPVGERCRCEGCLLCRHLCLEAIRRIGG